MTRPGRRPAATERPATRGAVGARAARGNKGDGVDRRAVLDVASRLLANEGPSALTMRRLADEVGASTMVLYSRFEGREGLMNELLIEGFSRFADALGAVMHPDPWEHLRQLGRAYRRFATENPTYYRLMWGSPQTSAPLPRDCAPLPLQAHGQRAFGALLVAITRILADLDRPARDAEPLAMSVWSTVHGFVSLELAGVVGPSADEAYEVALDFVLAALRR